MNKIDSILAKDKEFIENSTIINFNPHFDFHLYNIDEIKTENVLVYCGEERIYHEFLYDKLMEEFSKFNKKIKISQSSSTNLKNSVNPITNLAIWKAAKIPLGVEKTVDKIETFPHNKILNLNEDRNIKSILSIRRSDFVRDKIFTNIKSVDNQIVRYCNLQPDNLSNEIITNTFPSWYQLYSEYENSYLSFTIESVTNIPRNVEFLSNPLTEKTLISFLTGTIPIVYGSIGYVKELQNMGFYIANDEFGFDGVDELCHTDLLKIKKFTECHKNITNLSLNELKTFWNSKIDRIKNNRNIILKSFSTINFEDIKDGFSKADFNSIL